MTPTGVPRECEICISKTDDAFSMALSTHNDCFACTEVPNVISGIIEKRVTIVAWRPLKG